MRSVHEFRSFVAPVADTKDTDFVPLYENGRFRPFLQTVRRLDSPDPGWQEVDSRRRSTRHSVPNGPLYE